MADEQTQQRRNRKRGFAALWRFLPMLWPRGEAELKARVIAAVVLVLAGKAATLLMPFAYKAVIDGMSGRAVAFGVVAGLVAAYATARFAGVLVGQSAQCLVREGRPGRRAAARGHRSSATSMTCRCASTWSGAPDR